MRDCNQPLEYRLGGAAIDRACSERDPLAQILRLAGDDERGGTVEEHDVAARAMLAGEEVAQLVGVVFRIATFELLAARPREADLFRRHREGPDFAVTQLGDLRRPGRGELVDTLAVDYPGALAAEPAQHLGERLDPLRRKDADELSLCAGRVRERPEDVEDG